jgi:hypothetical protein
MASPATLADRVVSILVGVRDFVSVAKWRAFFTRISEWVHRLSVRVKHATFADLLHICHLALSVAYKGTIWCLICVMVLCVRSLARSPCALFDRPSLTQEMGSVLYLCPSGRPLPVLATMVVGPRLGAPNFRATYICRGIFIRSRVHDQMVITSVSAAGRRVRRTNSARDG